MIDTVIFDLDGTLLDTLSDLADSTNAALSMNHLKERTKDEVRLFVGNGIRMLIRRAVPAGCSEELEEKVYEDFKKYYQLHCNDKTKPYPGIMELLEKLEKRGFSMAIVSNKADAAVKKLNEIYFSQYIKTAIGENEAAGIAKKPAPDTVNAALLELGKTKKTAVYIGDSDVDLETAKNSNMEPVSVLWGFRDITFLKDHGAKTLVENTEELYDFLINHN